MGGRLLSCFGLCGPEEGGVCGEGVLIRIAVAAHALFGKLG